MKQSNGQKSIPLRLNQKETKTIHFCNENVRKALAYALIKKFSR